MFLKYKMATKKIPISINETDQANLKELIELMGIVGVYGDIPKAMKFGINLALATIKSGAKVYPLLNDADLDIYLSSIKRFETKRRLLEKAKELQKEAQKV